VFAVSLKENNYSIDRGKHWERMNEENTDPIGSADPHRSWAIGKKGLILKFEGTVPGEAVPNLKK